MTAALRYAIIGFCIMLIMLAVYILIKSISKIFKGKCVNCVFCQSCEKRRNAEE